MFLVGSNDVVFPEIGGWQGNMNDEIVYFEEKRMLPQIRRE